MNGPIRWSYFRIYANPRIAQQVLMVNLIPLIEDLSENKYITSWFYVRYFDGEPHLRLRLLPSEQKNAMVIKRALEIVLDPFIQRLYIWRLQEADYHPETTRFGRANIDHIEALFQIQSQLALVLWAGEKEEQKRFLLSCFCLHRMLDHLVPNDKLRFVQQQRDRLKTQLVVGRAAKKKISSEFRSFRPRLIKVMEMGTGKEQSDVHSALTVYQRAFDQLVPPQDTLESYRWLADILHMFLNKCFLYHHEQAEFLCYEFLVRTYRSLYHRNST